MMLFVLVVWFGNANQQVTFSVPGIATQAECIRLGNQMKRRYKRSAVADCYPYRGGISAQ